MLKVSQAVNELFLPLWEKKARYFILLGGRGAGRSTTGSQYLLSKLLGPEFFRAAIMREIASDIRSTIWQELMDRIEEQALENTLDIGTSMMTVKYGMNSIHSHGFRQSSGDHSAKLKSLANYNTVLIEEANEVGEREFLTLDHTLRTVKGNIKIILLLNPPPKTHWIIERWFDCIDSGTPGFYKIKLKDGITDAVFIGGNWRNNAANLDRHTIENYEMMKRFRPEYYWQEIAGLVPEVVRGKIYHGWELIDELPRNARLLRVGGDWGWFPDPVATIALYYCDGAYIVDGLTYGVEMEDDVVAAGIRTLPEGNKIRSVFGADEPKSIELMKKKGINAVESIAGPGSVETRIKITAEKKIKVVRKNDKIYGNWVWDAYMKYHWAEDKDGNSKGRPDHEGSDPMDAISYAIADLVGEAGGSGFSVMKPNWVRDDFGRVAGRGYSVNFPASQIPKPGAPQPINLPPHIAKNVIFPKGF